MIGKTNDPVEKVLREQPGYYGWILNSEFPLYTKKVLTAIKLLLIYGINNY